MMLNNTLVVFRELRQNIMSTSLTIQHTSIGFSLLAQNRLRQAFQKLTSSILHSLSYRLSLNCLSLSCIAILMACLYRYLRRNRSSFMLPLRGRPMDAHSVEISTHCSLSSSSSGVHQNFCGPGFTDAFCCSSLKTFNNVSVIQF